jgi:hypothetical protein
MEWVLKSGYGDKLLRQMISQCPFAKMFGISGRYYKSFRDFMTRNLLGGWGVGRGEGSSYIGMK